MRILVAEDVGLTRRQLVSVLEDAGHEVVAVGDGEAAWLEFERAPFPLALIDWMMPRMDGLELCRRIRAAAGENVFLVLQTGRATSEDLDVALAAGIDDYMAKPVTPEHLRARISVAETRIAQRAERRAMLRELEHARWVAGVCETVLGMQHEIASPLTTLMGELALGQDSRDPAVLHAALDAALVQAQRIAEVLRRVGAITAPQSVEPVAGIRMLDIPRRDEDPA